VDCDRVIAETLRVNLASGVTTVRDLGDRNYAVLDWRQRHAGEVTPTILASGPPITTPRGHCWNMGGIRSPQVVDRTCVRLGTRVRGARIVAVGPNPVTG
jgi:hypothetical protein